MKRFFKNLKYIKLKDIFSVFYFLSALPFALVFKLFNKDYWIVSEDAHAACDNGYWFFKYVRENHPEQKVCYAITKKSHDKHKVEALGKVINFGSWKHYIYYLGSSKKISSQKGSKPNAALFNFLEVYGLIKNKRYFLQHGVTINDGKWLYYKNTKFKMFVCGAKPEYQFIKDKFGYPENTVKYLGFCRYDYFHQPAKQKEQILVMPTWRSWIARDYIGNKSKKAFTETDYFKYWKQFLTSKKLAQILEQTDKTLLFYPHQNMQQFLDYFKTDNPRIIIADKAKYDIQKLLIESQVLITDYSSVFTDFAYMKKPIIFYQFDHAEFFQKQYANGYFDYKTSKMGIWSDKQDEVLNHLQSIIKNNCRITKDNLQEINEFFYINDASNCQRTYQAIKND